MASTSALIYTDDHAKILLGASYNAKRLLDDSVERTSKGIEYFTKESYHRTIGNILLARIESAVSFAFVATSGAFMLIPTYLVLSPFAFLVVLPLNLISRLFSAQFMQNFKNDTNNLLYRTFRIAYTALPVILTYLVGSGINTFLPILKVNGIFFNSIHRMLKDLGELEMKMYTVPYTRSCVGSIERLSFLSGIEEYLRGLSSQNYYKEITVNSLRIINTEYR